MTRTFKDNIIVVPSTDWAETYVGELFEARKEGKLSDSDLEIELLALKSKGFVMLAEG